MVRNPLSELSSRLSDQYRQYRRGRREARRLRRLRRLRHGVSEAGYSLQQFDAYRCLFVHIPKCAGVSVCQSLFGNLGAGHHDLATYRKLFSAQEFESYFKFAFVRNPWDRLLSAYTFLQAGGFHAGDRRWARQELGRFADFDSFVTHWLDPDSARSWIHFRPQYEFICDADGRPGLDFIGRYERLAEDFSLICARLGIEAELQRLNIATSRGDYRTAYSDTTRRIVAEVYSEDVAFFGYDFDNLSPPPHQNSTNSRAPSSSR
jgi:hypothetical protein